jgi:hypothetical protein
VLQLNTAIFAVPSGLIVATEFTVFGIHLGLLAANFLYEFGRKNASRYYKPRPVPKEFLDDKQHHETLNWIRLKGNGSNGYEYLRGTGNLGRESGPGSDKNDNQSGGSLPFDLSLAGYIRLAEWTILAQQSIRPVNPLDITVI